MDRREYLKLLGAASVGVTLPGCAPQAPASAEGPAGSESTDPPGDFEGYAPQFFTAAEFQTIRVLTDIIIPADAVSGSASQAKVPEFIDFTAMDREQLQVPLRGGLAWTDEACRRSFGNRFTECSGEEQIQIVERIAWPDAADEQDLPGVSFFTLLRDMTASGFYSSAMGMEDVGYRGNEAVAVWTGC
ncbi:MAG: gluconate 2-dehydrogenase subunit 3 family protein [Rhodothermales bacterium]|nr:gluconate 2-dehydrogenase subunit 3 family protein [Rhodothermales bacterium]